MNLEIYKIYEAMTYESISHNLRYKMRYVHLEYVFIYILVLTRITALSLSLGDISLYTHTGSKGGKPNNGAGDDNETSEVTRQFKTRCTRRFSPGVCANQVSPVWTYVFQEQNCTERLGCASYFRSNRFKNYAVCMRHCQGLVDVYLQMIEADASSANLTAPLRKGPKPTSTFVQVLKQGAPSSSTEGPKEIEYDANDYEQGENETHSVVYKELINNYEIFPPDVDREDGEIRSQYDLLHP